MKDINQTAMSFTDREVVIFGASAVGEVLMKVLAALGAQVTAIADNSTTKHDTDFFGFQVLPLGNLLATHPNAPVVVASERYFSEISAQLQVAGFAETFSPKNVVDCIDFKEVDVAKLDSVLWYLARHGKFAQDVRTGDHSLHMPRLNVVVTSRCTLNCEHCSSLMPYYDKQADFDLDVILGSLGTLLDAVDMIYHVEILGGEPLLNKASFDIAEYLLATGKILHIDVITNGTVLPRVDALQRLAHDRLSVVIDDYGDLSTKREALIDRLVEAGVDHRVHRHWTWADLGGFESRELDTESLKETFSACNFNSCTELLDGKLYRCPRSSHGTNLGLIPNFADDVFDLKDMHTGLKPGLKAFVHDKDSISACNHCNGNSGETLVLEPARQLER
jgi:hypothetical protein